MSRIDWNEMLTGLEKQRSGIAQELADVDAVIETVRQRAAPKVSVAALQRPRAKPSKNGAPKQGQGIKVDPATLAPLREQYERGVPVAVIAKKVGKTASTIYGYASVYKWRRPGVEEKLSRPNPGAAASPAAAAPIEQTREELSGQVRCTNCDLWTRFDPCSNCGKKLKRNW